MKRALFSLMTLIVLVALTGCVTQRGRHPLLASDGNCEGGNCAQATDGCQSCEAPCNDANCLQKLRARLCKDRMCKERSAEPAPAAAGPATGAITYPYYTTRGPRDFYAKNPTSIGP